MGVVLMLFCIATAALGVWFLSRQSNRNSNWFYMAQSSQSLSLTALKEAAYFLEENNDVLAGGMLQPLYQALQAGNPAPVISIPLGQGSQVQIERLDEEGYAATVEVTVTGVPQGPIQNGSLAGIPADPSEVRGVIRLEARAEVVGAGTFGSAGPLGSARIATMERNYRIVTAIPPLLGRFTAFVEQRPTQDLNTFASLVKRTGIPTEIGDGIVDSGLRPLVFSHGVAADPMDRGERFLSRIKWFQDAGGEADFLDRQGWIYLGSGGGTDPWVLNLQHGYTEYGESNQFFSDYQTRLFGGSTGRNQTFKQTVEQVLTTGTNCIAHTYLPSHGLRWLFHGFATNYELVGIDNRRKVQNARGDRTHFKSPDTQGEASLLRLFGTAEEFSPTLVFGPVNRNRIRKAFVRLALSRCPFQGTHYIPVFMPGEDPTKAGALMNAMFGADRDEEGSRIGDQDAYLLSLNEILDTRIQGKYNAQGFAQRVISVDTPTGMPTPQETEFTSNVLGTLPQPDGIPDTVVDPIFAGDLDLPGVYQGNLSQGLSAFHQVVSKKTTYIIPPAMQDTYLNQRMLRANGTATDLHVPGVVYFEQSPLTLPAIDDVPEGGILIAAGDITLTGNIAAQAETLTLVSINGDIRIEPGVGEVRAGLVSLSGTIRFPDNDFVLVGTYAARDLDLAAVGPNSLKVQYDPALDPQRTDKPYRIYFGDGAQGPKIAISGGRGSP